MLLITSRNCSLPLMSCPLTFSTICPAVMPANAAGLSLSTLLIQVPRNGVVPKASARSRVTEELRTPSFGTVKTLLPESSTRGCVLLPG